jgi:hypothetical protein
MADETTTYDSIRHSPWGLIDVNTRRVTLRFREAHDDFQLIYGERTYQGITAVEYRFDGMNDAELWLDYSALGSPPAFTWAPVSVAPYADENQTLKFRFSPPVDSEPVANVWWIYMGTPPYTLMIKVSKKIAVVVSAT